MNGRTLFLCLALLAPIVACHSPPAPIFPALSPPLVWPKPPEQPRVQYIGELRGESSLGRRPGGWEAFRAFVAGPQPPTDFSRPAAVAVRGERVYVADIGLAVVHVLDLSSREYGLIHGSPTDALQVPIDLALDPDGSLIVVDRGRAAIDRFDTAGAWQATRRSPQLTDPVAAVCGGPDGQRWILDVAAHACLAWPEGAAAPTPSFGGRGAEPGRLNYPTGLAWHPELGLAVADAMNFRVQLFDRAGEPTTTFGKKGDAAGDFARPRDVAFDSAQHVYVLDNRFENVQIFDHQGRLLLAFGQSGDGPGEFSLPSGITIDDRDRIWVADSYNHRVQVFQYLSENTP